jgi:type I restriction enzyme M protein
MPGDAYEYLIGQFAAGSGKKAGTPQQILISSPLSSPDSQEPANGKKIGWKIWISPAAPAPAPERASGMGGMIGRFWSEKNITTYNLARMNMPFTE